MFTVACISAIELPRIMRRFLKCCECACNTAKYVIGIGSKKLEIAICTTCLNALRKDIDRLFYPAIKPISKDNKDAMQ